MLREIFLGVLVVIAVSISIKNKMKYLISLPLDATENVELKN